MRGPGRGRGHPAAILLKPRLRARPLAPPCPLRARPVLGAAGGMYVGRKRKKPVPKRWVRGGGGRGGLACSGEGVYPGNTRGRQLCRCVGQGRVVENQSARPKLVMGNCIKLL